MFLSLLLSLPLLSLPLKVLNFNYDWITIDDYENYVASPLNHPISPTFGVFVRGLCSEEGVLMGVYEPLTSFLRHVEGRMMCGGGWTGTECRMGITWFHIAWHFANVAAVRCWIKTSWLSSKDVNSDIISTTVSVIWGMQLTRLEPVLWRSAGGYLHGLPFALFYLSLVLREGSGGGGMALAVLSYVLAMANKASYASLPLMAWCLRLMHCGKEDGEGKLGRVFKEVTSSSVGLAVKISTITMLGLAVGMRMVDNRNEGGEIVEEDKNGTERIGWNLLRGGEAVQERSDN